MANKVKEVWASGKAVVNAWLAIPSGFSAEVIAPTTLLRLDYGDLDAIFDERPELTLSLPPGMSATSAAFPRLQARKRLCFRTVTNRLPQTLFPRNVTVGR